MCTIRNAILTSNQLKIHTHAKSNYTNAQTIQMENEPSLFLSSWDLHMLTKKCPSQI